MKEKRWKEWCFMAHRQNGTTADGADTLLKRTKSDFFSLTL